MDFIHYQMTTKQQAYSRKLFCVKDDRYNQRDRLTVEKWNEQWVYFSDFDGLNTEDKPYHLITYMFNIASTFSRTRADFSTTD